MSCLPYRPPNLWVTIFVDSSVAFSINFSLCIYTVKPHFIPSLFCVCGDRVVFSGNTKSKTAKPRSKLGLEPRTFQRILCRLYIVESLVHSIFPTRRAQSHCVFLPERGFEARHNGLPWGRLLSVCSLGKILTKRDVLIDWYRQILERYLFYGLDEIFRIVVGLPHFTKYAII